MTDLADFLRGRIGEEERLAHLARDTEPALWADIEKGGIPDLDATMATVAMMNRWSPGLVLVECEAKRRIIDLHPSALDSDGDEICLTCSNLDPTGLREDVQTAPCETLRALALPYSDRPDYRAQWRP